MLTIKGYEYMVILTDLIKAIITGLIIICCILAAKNYWKVKNTDAFMWVLVALFLCVDDLSRSLQT
jgi:hypothetical protein